MSMKICPVCDKQVNSINFCTTCKKFVRPKIVYTNTVLNESRTQDKSDGDLYVEMMKDEDRSKRKITGTAVIIMLIIMVVILVIGVMAVLPRAKEKNASKKADEIVERWLATGEAPSYGYYSTEEITEAPYYSLDGYMYDYGNYENSEKEKYKSSIAYVYPLTDEEVRNAKEECNMCDHYYGVLAGDYMDSLCRQCQEKGLDLELAPEYGSKTNLIDVNERRTFTKFSVIDYLVVKADERMYFVTNWDYRTGGIHSTELNIPCDDIEQFKKDRDDPDSAYSILLNAMLSQMGKNEDMDRLTKAINYNIDNCLSKVTDGGEEYAYCNDRRGRAWFITATYYKDGTLNLTFTANEN